MDALCDKLNQVNIEFDPEENIDELTKNYKITKYIYKNFEKFSSGVIQHHLNITNERYLGYLKSIVDFCGRDDIEEKLVIFTRLPKISNKELLRLSIEIDQAIYEFVE
jgi:hypothetical protein